MDPCSFYRDADPTPTPAESFVGIWIQLYTVANQKFRREKYGTEGQTLGSWHGLEFKKYGFYIFLIAIIITIEKKYREKWGLDFRGRAGRKVSDV